MQALTKRIIFGTITIFLLSYSSALAQIEVEPALSTPLTPENLIQEVFAGKGVEITNVSFAGQNEAVGYFKNGSTDVGIESGFLMTTGRAVLAAQANGNEGDGDPNESTAMDATLASIANVGGTEDVAVYEIEFIPQNDTIEFRYVFASEEYPEFGCSCFNDVFGFFLRGPGYNDWTNLAIVPGTLDDPVSVKTIHPVDPDGGSSSTGGTTCPDGTPLPDCNPLNEHLYVDNVGSTTLTYDGLTTILTAKTVVEACQTYSIKLAIADVGDALYDSAIFFEANSFGSDALQIALETESIDGALIEGCAGGSITFSFDQPVQEDYRIELELGGNVVRQEYTIEPLTDVIPAGETSLTLNIRALTDDIVEPLDSIEFKVNLNGCSEETHILYIRDPDLNNLELGEDQTICPGDSATLDGSIGVIPPQETNFAHSGGNIDINTVDDNGTGPDMEASVSRVQITGVQPDIIRSGLIKEVCVDIAHSNLEDIDLFLESPDGALLELSTDNGGSDRNYEMTCFSPTAMTPITAGTAPFSGQFAPEGDWKELYGGATNGEWKLYVKDDTKDTDGFLINWSITFNPLYELTYQWTPTTGLSCSDCPMPKAAPDMETLYSLEISDSYGCIIRDSVLVKTDTDTIPITINCIEETQTSITFGWSPTSGVAYEVNIDGQGWEPANGAGAHSVNDIAQEGQTIFIEVRGIGDCINQRGETDCTTSICFPPDASVERVLDQSCFEKEDGQIDLRAGNPNIIFVVSNDTLMGTSLTNLKAGSYGIVAIDTLTTCDIILDTVISSPDSIILDTFKTIASCGNNDAIAAIIPSGGTMPYNILWDIGQNTDTIRNLEPGTYTVRLTDEFGCEATQSITIEENDTPTPMDLPINCEEVTPTSITFSWAAVQGISAYEVKIGEEDWRDPIPGTSILIADLGVLESVDIQVRAMGECITILDSTSCTTADCIVPEGSFDVVFEGRCTDYTDGVIAISSAMPDLLYILEGDTVTNGVFEDLLPGEYEITLLDTLTGCSTVMGTELANRAPLIVETFEQSQNCGALDGIAAVTVSGGVAPYEVSWSNGEVGDTIRNLETENYFATITDAVGCSTERRLLVNLNAENLRDLRLVVDCPVVTNNSITFTWEEIPIVTDYEININGEGWRASEFNGRHEIRDLGFSEIFNFQVRGNTNCGDAVLGNQICATNSCIPPTVSFGTPTGVSCVGDQDGELEIIVNTFEFSFIDTIPFCVVKDSLGFNVIDFNCFRVDTLIAPIGGLVILGTDTLEATEDEPTVSYGDLLPGTYILQLMDTTLTCRSTIDYTIEEPDTLKLATIEEEAITCPEGNDAILVVEAEGGTGPYEYDWNEGLHDSDVFTDLGPGEYIVVTTDANDCTTSEAYIIEEPAPVVQSVLQINNGCGETNAGVAGVRIDTSYMHTITWTTGSTADTITDLPGGDYLGIISTENGCRDSVEVRIEEIILELETTANNPICGNADAVLSGSAFVTATGNDQTAYSYRWNDDMGQTTDTATTLAPGMYIVTVTDNTSQCSKTDTVTLTAPPEISTMILDMQAVSCPETNDGFVVFNIEGGVQQDGSYRIDWGDGTIGTEQGRNNLNAGDYTITITDDVGCEMPLSFIIGGPDSIQLSITATPINCDNPTSIATVEATGGSGDFNYQWNDTNRQTTPVASNLTEDSFQVIVTDNETSCITMGAIDIVSQIPFDLVVSSTPSQCQGEATGTASVEVTGGSGNYKYLWDDENTQETPQATDLAPGDYMLLVIDEDQGCEKSVTVTVENAAMDMEITFAKEDVSCNGFTDGSSEATVIGTDGSHQYKWSNGATTRAINELPVGEYTLTVTDVNGCVVLDTVRIVQPDSLSGSVSDLVDVSCEGNTDGSIAVAVNGGSGNYEYAINGNQFGTDSVFTNLRPNTYFVKARDEQGCEIDFGSVRINEPTAIVVDIRGESIISSDNPINLEPEVVNGQGILNYTWSSDTELTSLSCTDCPSPEISPATAQMYLVTVTDQRGCEATATFNILVRRERSSAYVPTAFSPNSDGINDLLVLHGEEGTQALSFKIFNRWGELVFEKNNFMANDIEAAWNGIYQGQLLTPDVFIWSAEVRYPDGEEELINGHFTLIR